MNPKPVMSVQACTLPAGSVISASAASRFSCHHHVDRRVRRLAAGPAELDRGGDDAGAERLGEEEDVAGRAPAFVHTASGATTPVTA